ncbi:MAG: DNA/RNA nuclease SfsA [Clostridiales bacterium]|nr:DNA/RNA nuclease SfsA [Clostridiales bacterium]
MIYKNIVNGTFLSRPNRFIAKVLINNEEELAHVKNTGRCKELLIPGCKLTLQQNNNSTRKTQYSVITVKKNNQLFNIDSQVPNQVVAEALKDNKIFLKKNITFLKRENTFLNSRFDIYFETSKEKAYMEIKGVTLEKKGIALFPDAPTKRGVKHVYEMIKAVKQGYSGYLFFLLQMTNCKYFTTNKQTDPEFAKALLLAKESGVQILCYDSIVTKNGIILNKKILTKIV